ncbi:MAG: hypothetical protein K0R77_3084 [Chryseobacterium sp.]|jgi:hypothetical protein|nr:hypothetical protein [Chryseobacterium sp.]
MYQKKVLMSENQQIKYLIKVIALVWFVTKIWSYKTWVAERIYPVIPPFDFLKYIPDSLHLIIFGLSLLNLLLIVFLRVNRLLLISLFLFEFLSCLLDTVRWQPWEYMYLCMLAVIIINFSRPKNIIFLFHLLLVSMYLFSGLHKFNRSFLSTFWMDEILKDFFGLSLEIILKFKLFFAGLLIPVIEVLLAISLLVSKSKRKISLLLIIMHICILILIGPFGLNYNSVIWFWNFTLIFILFLLYALPVEKTDSKMILNNSYWLILWFIMPIFSFFGNWYQYFSFNLYSGKGYQMYICVNNDNYELKPYLEPVDGKLCKDKPYLNLQNWAMSEIKSAPFPDIEVYQKIGIGMKKKYGNKNVKIFLHNTETRKTIEL